MDFDTVVLDDSPQPAPAESVDRAPSRRLAWLMGAAVLLLVALVGLAGAMGYRDLAASQRRAADLETQIGNAEQRVLELSERLEMLRDDPELLEQLAREELGLVAPGDIVVVLPSPP